MDPEFRADPLLVGLVFVLDSFAYTAMAPFVGFFSDRPSLYLTLLAIGNFGLLIAYSLLGPLPFLPIPSDTVWHVIVAIAVVGLFFPFAFMPTYSAMISTSVKRGIPKDMRLSGLVSGTFASCFSLGSFIGPILGGYLTDVMGFTMAVSIACCLPVCILILIVIFTLSHKLFV